MQELLDRFLTALAGVGIRAMAAQPSKLAAHLKAPMTAVGVESVGHAPAGLGQYLGVLADVQSGERDVYGQLLEASIFFEVHSPVLLGGGRCFQEAMALLDFLLEGPAGVQVLESKMGRCRYEAKVDCFVCTLTAKVRAAVYTKPVDGADAAVRDIELKGEIL